ncbi:hypothetical protein QYE76_059031 [Lolium multiflorum]|uniref:Transposase (putative) gypsy type domain-containing protein n=1 Tax=Lolium multiflorum TaxID=4521 RepID=A0AAD8T653_LOLMU|nr:hypothetical protein QYE76_059031 [Lolium multiflorum]
MGNPASAAITHVLHNKQEFPLTAGMDGILVLSIGTGCSSTSSGAHGRNTPIDIGDEEDSPPRFTKPADGGKLADLFGEMTFGSVTETDLSQDSDSESFINFDFTNTTNSTASREVFADLYDGVTYLELDESTELLSMLPRTKLVRHTAPGTNASMEKAEIPGWERSKISNQDQRTLKKLGLVKKEGSLIFPGDERFPRPPIGYRLHQLTPNSILHISIFITLCECFLGTHPHWGLWKRIFYLRRNSFRNVAYNVGGVCICV